MAAFSVIIPARNRIALLRRAVASVQQQAAADWELIVVDDGSSEDIEGALWEAGATEATLVSQTHQGAAAARNAGAAHASKDYLVFLDSDDEAKPGWLKGFDELASAGNVVLFCGMELYRAGRATTPNEHVEPRPDPLFGQNPVLFRAGTYAVHHEAFTAVGGFAEEMRSGQHTELGIRLMWHVAARGGHVGATAATGVRCHVHEGPSIRKDAEAIVQGTRCMLEWHSEVLARHRPLQANYWGVLGVNYARLDRRGQALAAFVRAVLCDPWRFKHYARLGVALLPLPTSRLWNERVRS